MNNYFYDENNIRCNLLQTNGRKSINWLFIPGGPGVDSRYFKNLIQLLKLPGNVWLIDLPGNGDHLKNVDPDYNYDHWFDIFKELVMRFDNPVVIGHSFGAMLVMLTPELESKLLGFISLNSAPALWLEDAAKMAKEAKLPDLTPAMTQFTLNPNQSSFEKALEACLPYYFPTEDSMIKGRKMLNGLPFRYQPAVWFQRKAIEINYNAKWVPNFIPTLILNSEKDYICPYTLFKKDKRFQRPNIKSIIFENAGHMPWLEKPAEVIKVFEEFSVGLTVN